MVSMIGEGVWQISHLELTLRMLLAVILGGLVGMERELNNHAAGFRTHILVCLGSATIMLLSMYGFSQFINENNVRVDPARLAAQVISGIGFLGAGAIIRNGSAIKGLTTAASVWVVAAIGLCAGSGFYTGAILCTLMSLISLFVLNKWEKYVLRNRRTQDVEIKILDRPGVIGSITSSFGMHGVHIANLRMAPDTDVEHLSEQPHVMNLNFSLRTPKPENLLAAYQMIAATDAVLSMQSSSFSLQKQTGSD